MRSSGSHLFLTPQDAQHALAECEASARREETPCGDGSMVWRIWGHGEPLVLMHGSHGNWAHWIRNIAALSRHYTLYVPDLPGTGQSADPGTTGHGEYVRPLARGLRDLGCDRVAVAGFSFGGVIAAHLAVNHPDMVSATCIVGSGGLGTPLGKLDLKAMRGLPEEERYEVNRHNLASLMLHAEQNIDALAIAIHSHGAKLHRIDTRSMVMPDHIIRVLHEIQSPFAAIWGALDAAHPDPTEQEAALRHVKPDVAFRVIEDAGHWCMFEQPECFNAALRDVLHHA